MKSRPLGTAGVKVIAVAVVDSGRAERFYGETLGLEPVASGDEDPGYLLGETIILLKREFYSGPTENPNPRITLAVEDAHATAEALKARGVVIRDPVTRYDDSFDIGSFIDSEGNKFWFCSAAK